VAAVEARSYAAAAGDPAVAAVPALAGLADPDSILTAAGAGAGAGGGAGGDAADLPAAAGHGNEAAAQRAGVPHRGRT